jgi:8-oxo-dGTP pyrophosphatase MutT (NUDIX family)
MGVTMPLEVSSAETLTLPPDRFSLDRISEALRGRAPRIIEGTTHAAGVALVLRPAAGGLEALFIKRAEHPNDPWSGHVGLPGGRVESHDEGLVHTAIRETAEEIGLSLAEDPHLLGPLDEIRATARTRSIDMKIAPFVFAAEGAPDLLTLSDEVAATHWIPLAEVFDSSHTASVTMPHAGQVLRFPAIEVRGLTIWGLTLRMLRNFEILTAER